MGSLQGQFLQLLPCVCPFTLQKHHHALMEQTQKQLENVLTDYHDDDNEEEKSNALLDEHIPIAVFENKMS